MASATVTELLDRLRRSGRAADFDALAELYAAEGTAESDRAAIRAAASTRRELMFGLEQWRFGISGADPERYVRLNMAVVSMSDGWPDCRDAFLLAKSLLKFADSHGERCRALLERLVAVSTPRVQHLFSSPTLNMTLWTPA